MAFTAQPDTPALTKQPAEDKLYDFELKGIMPAGNTLVGSPAPTVTQARADKVAGSQDLSLGAPSVSGTRVQVFITGGTANEDYKLTARATDNQGNRHEGDGIMLVRD